MRAGVKKQIRNILESGEYLWHLNRWPINAPKVKRWFDYKNKRKEKADVGGRGQ